jgi:hypothetical protein
MNVCKMEQVPENCRHAPFHARAISSGDDRTGQGDGRTPRRRAC